MSIKDAIDLLFAARERIDFYWNFYVVVVVAVVGWIVTRKERLSRSGKVLVSVAYVVAAVTNLAGIVRVIYARRSFANRSSSHDSRVSSYRHPGDPDAAFLPVPANRCVPGPRRRWSDHSACGLASESST
jgi:hypothetical protein